MSGIGCKPVHRIKGRPALVRRLRGLLLAVHRFARHRATTPAECLWAAQVIDSLTAALDVADPRSSVFQGVRGACVSPGAHDPESPAG